MNKNMCILIKVNLHHKNVKGIKGNKKTVFRGKLRIKNICTSFKPDKNKRL